MQLALVAAVGGYEVVGSELAVVEVTRAAARAAGADGVARAGAVLRSVRLRSLDAIHVASAPELGTAPEFVGYDDRLLGGGEGRRPSHARTVLRNRRRPSQACTVTRRISVISSIA